MGKVTVIVKALHIDVQAEERLCRVVLATESPYGDSWIEFYLSDPEEEALFKPGTRFELKPL